MFEHELYDDLLSRESSIAVVGLGYVGLPLAVAFAKKVNVIGFDISVEKIAKYRSGIDITDEVGDEVLRNSTVEFTSDATLLRSSNFIIVAVPTPISSDKTPDLYPVESASKVIGRNLMKGSVVVYESTVYPGVTEDICIPILERESGLKNGVDFKVGYSPERINPGDKLNRLENIVKIVSGQDAQTLDLVAKTYELVVEAGVYRADNIKVAEAAKVVENSQRDINIAFMNELSMVFSKMGIDTQAVIKAMSTKWNAMTFFPGLVGGHCIGVDPYYFIYRAEQLGYHSQIILSGRKINDDMPLFIAEHVIKCLVKSDKKIKGAKVAICGLTFKENCPDVRNTKVIDIINALKEFDIEVLVTDPMADKDEVFKEYGIALSHFDEIAEVDAVVLAVAHSNYKKVDLQRIKSIHKPGMPVLIDIKGIYNKEDAIMEGFCYWRL